MCFQVPSEVEVVDLRDGKVTVEAPFGGCVYPITKLASPSAKGAALPISPDWPDVVLVW